ncbi:hypothetical protein PRIPAC_88385 [Pristionchus pacificus]|uniref:Uncharacterized protein n=1 Tax=Pristionchus pacificus TaxID=54126 RepID=A0A2A6B5G1_PRIPA|nr:hypothetical protein PRIPAC_88385 [Pristionchus pacificus]|eukprot:PDM61125.1 hypothetical protein PRIPAC_50567 [Pristionchus pacificus]
MKLLLLLLLASSAQAYMIIAYNMNTSQDIQMAFSSPIRPSLKPTASSTPSTLVFKSEPSQGLAKELLREDYLKIVVDKIGAANKSITQDFVQVERRIKKATLLRMVGIDLMKLGLDRQETIDKYEEYREKLGKGVGIRWCWKHFNAGETLPIDMGLSTPPRQPPIRSSSFPLLDPNDDLNDDYMSILPKRLKKEASIRVENQLFEENTINCWGVGSNTTIWKRPPSSSAPHMWFSPEIDDGGCVSVVVGTLWARIETSWLPSVNAYTLGMSDTTNPLAMRIEPMASRPQYVCNGPVPNKCTGLGGENPNTQLTSTAPYGTSYDLFIY